MVAGGLRTEGSTRHSSQDLLVAKNEMNPNKTKDFDLRQAHSVVYQRFASRPEM
jgi:hypothetical protein